MKLRGTLGLGGLVSVAILGGACFDSGERWIPTEPEPLVRKCDPQGGNRCSPTAWEVCNDPYVGWEPLEECSSKGLICVESLKRCAECAPNKTVCHNSDVANCTADGLVGDTLETCDVSGGAACRDGGCAYLCVAAEQQKSNVGCEYWAVDLDNARISSTSNAAAQQFAVVVSNPQPDVPVKVSIFQDDGNPGDAPNPYEVATSYIAPLNLQVFKLGPREVDGSPEGQFNKGTHTAVTRHAYKVVTSFPVVAYQFNPLENANVFSNDASLLKPREAYTYDDNAFQPTYVVAGWPQTIAITDDPNTNFSSLFPTALRAFVAIVGTQESTKVRVRTKARVVPGGPIPATPIDGYLETTIGAFDVLNLESDDFNGDFTGSVIESDGPIAVFTGSEASDAPHFETLSERRCCADHLEDQLDPIRASGKKFVVPHTPSRTKTVIAAGANIKAVPEPDYVRIMSVKDGVTEVKTTLPAPDDVFYLHDAGDFKEVTLYADFMLEADAPISVWQVMASQDAAGVKRGLPGGDPSIIVVPPMEQHRPDYTFLVPDKYAFDFISVAAPSDAAVYLDGSLLDQTRCTITPGDGLDEETRGSDTPPFWVYTCQLGFATINPLKTAPDNVTPGQQNDGVHRLVATSAVMALVNGFDSFVSYGYAAGTELKELTVPK